MIKFTRLATIASLVACALSSSAYSQTPTAEQLQLFQSLPASQQQALAQQYGISLPSVSATSSSVIENPEVMQPRIVSNEADAKRVEVKKSIKPGQGNLTRFGLDLFAATPTTFAPVSEAPVPANYVVGPGDEIVVQLFGKENSTQRLRVNREGLINFSTLGPIAVGGMSFADVRELLTQRVEEQMIGVRSNISFGEMRSMQIFVMGEAYKPGAYTVSALTTISQAIYFSGGFATSGALRNIELKRDGKTVAKLDLYDLLLKGDARNDVRLIPGDVVLINPVKALVTVDGEVNRPAIYEIKAGEDFADLIDMAGGFSANAVKDKVSIKRISDSQLRDVLTVNLAQGQDLTRRLVAGDDVVVAKRSDALTNYVQIEGDVHQPGYFEWHHGLRVSDLFSSVETAFNPTSDINYALVVREVNPQRDIKVLQISLADAILNSNGNNNINLNSHDRVVVFNRISGQDLTVINESEDQAKTFEQAQQQLSQETVQADVQHQIQANDDLAPEQLTLIAQGNQPTEKQNIKLLTRNTRRALLAPILMRLNQQASYGLPPMIAEVSGEVKHPGFYPINNQSRVRDLVAAAGGLTADAYIGNSELARLVASGNDGHQLDVVSVSLQAALAGDPQANIELAARDRLNILAQPNVDINRTVVLKGEVRFPGTYTVKRGETLSHLIARAGGLTDYANPQGAVFTREALRLQEQKLLNDYAEQIRQETVKKTFRADNNLASAITNPTQTLAFVEEASKSKALGRMVVQLNQVMTGESDFMLEDGDFLFVPTFRNTVSIMGEVQLAITYLLDDKLDVDDYINKAGGIKKQADEDRIFVVRADGSVFKPNSGYWFGNHGSKLKPGDTIVVPLDTDYRDKLNIWTAATQILYQTGVAINALK